MTVKATIDGAIGAGLDAIRTEAEVPGEFPPDVVAAAEDAARRQSGTAHADRTRVPFVTLDPASATDLDQAFAIERSGDGQGFWRKEPRRLANFGLRRPLRRRRVGYDHFSNDFEAKCTAFVANAGH